MIKLTSPAVIQDIMRQNHFQASKNFGQNFLADAHYADKIVDALDVNHDDFVLEIGPGLGAITQLLAQKAGFVEAVEVDKRIIPILSDILGEFKNLTITCADILNTDISYLFAKYSDRCQKAYIVSNLPYNITTSFLMKIAEEQISCDGILLMLQQEAAERILSSCGSKSYGALSVMLQCQWDTKLLFQVPSTVFVPQPQVNSCVIGLTPKKEPLTAHNFLLFQSLVKNCFMRRRKTMLNAISAMPNISLSKDKLTDILQSVGIAPTERCEHLKPEQFVLLADAINQEKNH